MIGDATADYGTVAPGSTADCHDATGDCYLITISGTRPVAHWDAQVTETIGQGYPRTVHVGDSFADVPSSNPFYAYIETLFHSGVTGGCGAGLYCPSNTVTRAQMAVFLLKAKHGSAYAPPPARARLSRTCRARSHFAPTGSRSSRPRASPAAAAAATTVRATPSRARRWPSSCSRREHGAAYVPPPCTGVFADVPCPARFARLDRAARRRGHHRRLRRRQLLPHDPNTRGQMAVFLVKMYGLPLYGP